MKSHFYSHALTLPDDSEIEVEIEFEYRRGSPGIMWGDNACPPDPPEVEIIGATHLSPQVGGKVSNDFLKMMDEDNDLFVLLCEAGVQGDADDRDRAAENERE